MVKFKMFVYIIEHYQNKEIEILYNLFNPNINKTLQINKENIIYTKGNIKEV